MDIWAGGGMGRLGTVAKGQPIGQRVPKPLSQQREKTPEVLVFLFSCKILSLLRGVGREMQAFLWALASWQHHR